MEWNRPTRPAQPAGPAPAPGVSSPGAHHGGSPRRHKGAMFPGRVVTVFLLFAVTVLIVAVISSIMLSKNSTSDSKYVDESKLQAVFLNGGQVYFGHVKSLNSKSIQLKDIYYLRVNQQVQPDQKNSQAQQQDISLVKLGCELHGPQDEMVINREQVIFWENLKEDGQVAKAVQEYIKANPDGQKCQTNTQNTGTTNNAATPAPTPTPATNSAR